MRSKTRVLAKVPKSPSELPMWNYDGSSTGQVGGGGSTRVAHSAARAQAAGPAANLPAAPARHSGSLVQAGSAVAKRCLPLRHHRAFRARRCVQAPGDDSEVYLVPRAIYRDPFRGGDNILVM